MKEEKSQFNNSQAQSKVQKKPYKAPTLIQYGTVAKLTQGTRSRGKEVSRKST